MTLTENETRFIIWVVVSIFGLLGVVVGWILSRGVKQLESIAVSVNEIKMELGVLANDHSNLKNDVNELKQRINRVEKYQ